VAALYSGSGKLAWQVVDHISLSQLTSFSVMKIVCSEPVYGSTSMKLPLTLTSRSKAKFATPNAGGKASLGYTLASVCVIAYDLDSFDPTQVSPSLRSLINSLMRQVETILMQSLTSTRTPSLSSPAILTFWGSSREGTRWYGRSGIIDLNGMS
jgi:hypothetical protein